MQPKEPSYAASPRCERHAASAAAALANTLARNGPSFAVFGTYAVPEFFSATLGCTIAHPIYQTVDLSALCRSQ